MGKTMRNFRLDDAVYEAARTRAKHDYTTVTAVVERALREYAGLPVYATDGDEMPAPVNASQAAAQRAYVRASRKDTQ